ncbi:hypothetical protein A8H37_02670 [Burkholderia thailandensis]|nr:hypothetical protein A8H37_02670 [Burkholderia thailandensis]
MSIGECLRQSGKSAAIRPFALPGRRIRRIVFASHSACRRQFGLKASTQSCHDEIRQKLLGR